MAHPSNAFPKGFYLADSANAATGDFYAVQCITGGEVKVKGGGMFEYVTDAYTETASTSYVTINLPVGATIYGQFTEVLPVGSAKFIAYQK